jgi:hypothetical protein
MCDAGSYIAAAVVAVCAAEHRMMVDECYTLDWSSVLHVFVLHLAAMQVSGRACYKGCRHGRECLVYSDFLSHFHPS